MPGEAASEPCPVQVVKYVEAMPGKAAAPSSVASPVRKVTSNSHQVQPWSTKALEDNQNGIDAGAKVQDVSEQNTRDVSDAINNNRVLWDVVVKKSECVLCATDSAAAIGGSSSSSPSSSFQNEGSIDIQRLCTEHRIERLLQERRKELTKLQDAMPLPKGLITPRCAAAYTPDGKPLLSKAATKNLQDLHQVMEKAREAKKTASSEAKFSKLKKPSSANEVTCIPSAGTSSAPPRRRLPQRR
eukprot:gnl/MRDRNA2_/MRDRNA2_20453_c0_seq1.p1 gnl/MRDRNA2_/MRDRNA2_20453_c0~~gnl/MRDRNA2_/MRDRNA2_20453_c0_seq1.p1  ORF type:complete len:258 (-),score=53.44 gnl/MRDRNA2_/MRDRNA2_20453_c0_seq1:499-1227(-)